VVAAIVAVFAAIPPRTRATLTAELRPVLRTAQDSGRGLRAILEGSCCVARTDSAS